MGFFSDIGRGQIGRAFGFGSNGWSMNQAMEDTARRQRIAQREAWLKDLPADTGVDTATRAEVLQKVSSLDASKSNTTSAFAEIANVLRDAREGKGLYAIRKRNDTVQTLAKDMPGRNQLSTRSLV
jgi:hypothetical protein